MPEEPCRVPSAFYGGQTGEPARSGHARWSCPSAGYCRVIAEAPESAQSRPIPKEFLSVGLRHNGETIEVHAPLLSGARVPTTLVFVMTATTIAALPGTSSRPKNLQLRNLVT